MLKKICNWLMISPITFRHESNPTFLPFISTLPSICTWILCFPLKAAFNVKFNLISCVYKHLGGGVKTHSMIFLWNSLSTSNSQMTINLSLISWKKKSVSFLCLAYRIAIYYKLCWKTSHTANWSMWDLIHHTEWLRIESTLLGLLLPNYAFPWYPFPWCSDLQTNTFV